MMIYRFSHSRILFRHRAVLNLCLGFVDTVNHMENSNPYTNLEQSSRFIQQLFLARTSSVASRRDQRYSGTTTTQLENLD